MNVNKSFCLFVRVYTACPDNCKECAINTGNGMSECKSNKCDTGYGTKKSDKSCAGVFSYFSCLYCLFFFFSATCLFIQLTCSLWNAINLEAYAYRNKLENHDKLKCSLNKKITKDVRAIIRGRGRKTLLIPIQCNRAIIVIIICTTGVQCLAICVGVYVVCVCARAHWFWGQISRKWLKTETRIQWDTRFRTVLHVLWLKLLNLFISHPSSDLRTGSRLMNALNINSCHSPTKFSRPANLTTYTILSLFSLHVELAPHLISL